MAGSGAVAGGLARRRRRRCRGGRRRCSGRWGCSAGRWSAGSCPRLVSGGTVPGQGASEAIKTRLDEIARELLADFDRQVDEAVEALRDAVVRRRKMFAADLYQQFDLVQSLGSDPAMLDTQRRDAERFAEAFDACAGRARNAVAFSLAGV